jgi:hypothetical protein
MANLRGLAPELLLSALGMGLLLVEIGRAHV